MPERIPFGERLFVQAGRAGIFSRRGKSGSNHVVKRVAHCAAVVGYFETVAPTQLFRRAVQKFGNVFVRVNQVNQVLIIKPVREF